MSQFTTEHSLISKNQAHLCLVKRHKKNVKDGHDFGLEGDDFESRWRLFFSQLMLCSCSFITCKTYAQSTIASQTWIDILQRNLMRKGIFFCAEKTSEFRTSDLPSLLFGLQPSLPYRTWPRFYGSTWPGPFTKQLTLFASKQSWTQSRLSQSPKEFVAQLLGLNAQATEPCFGFCQ